MDDELSATSENPVQNKAITSALEGLQETGNAIQKDFTTLAANVAALQNVDSSLQEDIGVLQDEVVNMRTTEGATASAIAELQAENQAQKSLIEELQSSNAELKEQFTALIDALNSGESGQFLTKNDNGALVWKNVREFDGSVLEIHLKEGWNLVAMPGNILVEASDQAMMREIDAFAYDKQLKAFVKAETLEPLASYWFYARQECTIHFAVHASE